MGLIFSRLLFWPDNDALPATVMVMPSSPEMVDAVPLVMVKSPLATVVMSRPAKLSIPAELIKLFAVRSLVDSVRPPAPEWTMAGCVVAAFGINDCAPLAVSSSVPVPAIRLGSALKSTSIAAVFRVAEPKLRPPPVRARPMPTLSVRPTPRLNVPVLIISESAVNPFVCTVVPPAPA